LLLTPHAWPEDEAEAFARVSSESGGRP